MSSTVRPGPRDMPEPSVLTAAHYTDGVVCAVPEAEKAAYRAYAERAAALFKEYGALAVLEAWGDDVPEGKINSLHTAVHRKEGETVVMSFIAWPSKDVRDAAWEKIVQDPQMRRMQMPFDGSRMIYGGFEVLLLA